jgi:hypothetical protein
MFIKLFGEIGVPLVRMYSLTDHRSNPNSPMYYNCEWMSAYHTMFESPALALETCSVSVIDDLLSRFKTAACETMSNDGDEGKLKRAIQSLEVMDMVNYNLPYDDIRFVFAFEPITLYAKERTKQGILAVASNEGRYQTGAVSGVADQVGAVSGLPIMLAIAGIGVVILLVNKK